MTECICKGNFRQIVSECESEMDKEFQDEKGITYTFYGVVWGSDDFYYGMYRKGESRLLSCVGSIEGHGFKRTG